VDYDAFCELAERALREPTPALVAAALAAYGGPLLPEDLYEPWAASPRERARTLHLDLLRQAQMWDAVLQEEPTDEQAHLALMRRQAERGDVRGALRQYERLEQALRRELGTVPSPEAAQLRARLSTDVRRPASGAAHGGRLFGRRDVGDLLRNRFEQAAAGRGCTLLFTGPAWHPDGVGASDAAPLRLWKDSGRTRRCSRP
jgi:hypothetical protein